MNMPESERIDKILWAIRVFKTRTEATEACKGGKVKVGGTNAKPSRPMKVGETIEVRKGAVRYTFRLKKLLGSRVGAALVPDYAENLTPQEELDKQRAPVETFFVRRDRGMGRPTKKDRRSMEDAWDNLDLGNLSFEVPDDGSLYDEDDE